jgi:hypothetical protein
MQDSRQVLFQTGGDKEMYDWIAHINYASAFKTADVRIRAGGLSKQVIELTGVAAATSHLREIERRNNKSSLPSPVDMWPTSSSTNGHQRKLGAVTNPRRQSESPDLPEQTSPQSECSSIQFKATFDQVKADLAGTNGASNGTPMTPLRSLSLEIPSAQSPISIAQNGSPARQSSRTAMISRRIHHLDSKISEARSQIDSDLHFIRNVAILTPFQRTTRDRLQVAVNNMVKKIMQTRLEVAKLVCHKDILSEDLVAVEVEWQETKETALNAAKELLQNRVMTIAETDTAGHQLSPIPINDGAHHKISSNGSPHIALDHGQSPTDITPMTEASSSVGSFLFQQDDDARSSMERQDGREGAQGPVHERFYTAPEMPEEQAEEWNKTKAAKRVSLVRLPTDLKMSLPKPLRSVDDESNSPALFA